MAVKITNEDGKYDVFKTKCPHCGRDLEYSRKDIKPHVRWRNGFIYCPGCTRPVGHDESNFSYSRVDSVEENLPLTENDVVSYETYRSYKKQVNAFNIIRIFCLIFGIVFMIVGTILAFVFIVRGGSNTMTLSMAGVVNLGIVLIVLRSAVFGTLREHRLLEIEKYDRFAR